MLFNSTTFAVFFALVSTLYWLLRRWYSLQNILLLVASYVFYGWWDVRFLFLIVMTTAADYCYGLMIGKGFLERRQRLAASVLLVASAVLFVTLRWNAVRFTKGSFFSLPDIDWNQLFPSQLREWWVVLASLAVVLVVNALYPWFLTFSEQRRSKVFLVASLITNLGTLGFFKYFNFFAESLQELMTTVFGIPLSPLTLSIVLPVGISFFTFQSLSYTIDVYYKRMNAEESLTILLTCMAFFPQLVAGPIERAAHLLPQFHRTRTVTSEQVKSGVWLVVWGLFQKLVVADNAAVIVNTVFRPFDTGAPFPPVPEDGLRTLFAVYAFAIQIFGDFSGYTDIARGTARLLGFDIMLNFNVPYFAISPSDFWRRWHISLSTWLRDYLYIPLGGNRGGTLRMYRNLFLTMLLGGLWHGAAWTYVFWGIFHGLILIFYHAFFPNLGTRPKASASQPENSEATGGTPWYGSVLKNFGHIFAAIVMFHLTCLGWLLFRAQNVATIGIFLQSILLHPFGSPEAAKLGFDLISCCWFLLLFQTIQAWTGSTEPLAKLPWFARLNIWLFVIMSLVTLSAEGEQSFIYFAF